MPDADEQVEFVDDTQRRTRPLAAVDWAALRRPGGLVSPVTAAAGLAVHVIPGRSAAPLGVVLVALTVVRASQRLRPRRGPRQPDRRVAVAAAVVAAALGVTLLVWPAPTLAVLGRLVGGYLAVAGLGAVTRAVRRPGRVERWPLISGVLTALFGLIVLAVPRAVGSFAVLLVGMGWLLAGSALTMLTLQRGRPVDPAALDRVLPLWLQRRAATGGQRAAVHRRLFFEGPEASTRLGRFFVLMGFASAIAAFGIGVDSTAVVVGAMLIAPLITPLMGTSAAVITGWPRRATRSVLIALAGAAVAVLVAVVFASWLPVGLDLERNSQITSRVAPTLIDLLIALAAGGAGAFATSRSDVSDALPGVAVAIALVPPLSVVGVTAQAGAFDLALGAGLLFATNAVGIVLAGSVVFVLTGVTPMVRIADNRRWIRQALATAGVFGLIVFAVLAVSSRQLLTQATSLDDATVAAERWAGDRYDVLSVEVDGDAIDVVVAGEDPPGSADRLATALAADLERDVSLAVQWVPRTTVRATASAP